MKSKILSVLQSVLPESDFPNSKDFLADGMLDSFDVVVITTELEGAFQISIPGDQITPENYSSLDNLAALVEQCLKRGLA
jgi:acyl carrier protein